MGVIRFHSFKAGREQSAWWPCRIGSALSYVGLYGLLTQGVADPFLILMLSALLYWGLIHQKRYQHSYFLRFQVLQALAFNAFFYVALQVLQAAFQFLGALLNLFALSDSLYALLPSIFLGLGLAWFGLSVVLALAALLGKSVRLPFLSGLCAYTVG